MKLVFKDLKHGEVKLIAENLDDIWHLYNIVNEGDLVRALTFRTDDQSSDDKKRSKKSEKKRMKLGIRVTEVRFHEFSDRLRIHGKIEEGPQDLGSFHTLNITADKMDAISIVKNRWEYHHLKRIDEAVKESKQPIVTFVSLDDECATVAVLRQSGVQWIADIDSKRSGKMYEDKKTDPNEYFGEILSVVKTNMGENSGLIIIGPGFTREHFVKYGREKNLELFSNCHVCSTGHCGMNGVQEAIKTGVVKQIAKENRVVFETEQIEKVFEEIRKNGLAAYGFSEVKNAVRNGAAERVLITDTLVRTKKGEEILRLAKENNSEFTIINTMHESGKKIEGIGGVAAILRFKI